MAGDSRFDTSLGVFSLFLALFCCVVSPNRLMLAIITVGFVAGQSWFGALFGRESRAWLIAIPATAAFVLLVRRFGGRIVRER